MNSKLIKKIRQQTRRQRKGYSFELAREIADMSFWQRLKYCRAVLKMKRAK